MNDTANTDKIIGQRLRLRRSMVGLSVEEVGALIGIGGQQIYKYETGTARIAAADLFKLAQGLGVPVDYFFIGGNGQEFPMPDPDIDRGVMQLIRDYQNLRNDSLRQRLRDLARLIGKEQSL